MKVKNIRIYHIVSEEDFLSCISSDVMRGQDIYASINNMVKAFGTPKISMDHNGRLNLEFYGIIDSLTDDNGEISPLENYLKPVYISVDIDSYDRNSDEVVRGVLYSGDNTSSIAYDIVSERLDSVEESESVLYDFEDFQDIVKQCYDTLQPLSRKGKISCEVNNKGVHDTYKDKNNTESMLLVTVETLKEIFSEYYGYEYSDNDDFLGYFEEFYCYAYNIVNNFNEFDELNYNNPVSLLQYKKCFDEIAKQVSFFVKESILNNIVKDVCTKYSALEGKQELSALSEKRNYLFLFEIASLIATSKEIEIIETQKKEIYSKEALDTSPAFKIK